VIVVSQGHEKGVGLEVLLKALLVAPAAWSAQVRLHADRTTVARHLKALKIDASMNEQGVDFAGLRLACRWVTRSTLPQSTTALLSAMEEQQAGDVLFTLPTTKDDLRDPRHPRRRYLGHTEFLRAHHRAPELGMFFTAPGLHALLLTDHIPLADVSNALTGRAFTAKFESSLKELALLEPTIKRAVVAGINPHAGEGGLLGREEMRLTPALQKLRAKHRRCRIEGFFPGDTLIGQRRDASDLLVYLHHDQGLAPFKALRGTLGANVTLGLPRLRLSVDHGTAFALYGKNMADHRGAYFCLRQALVYQERLGGKNRRQQGAGS
jgi:4-hydroxythreonine-4-phosphate dehydrogenase